MEKPVIQSLFNIIARKEVDVKQVTKEEKKEEEEFEWEEFDIPNNQLSTIDLLIQRLKGGPKDQWVRDLTRECVEPDPGPNNRTNRSKKRQGKNMRKQYKRNVPKMSLVRQPYQNVQELRKVANLSFVIGSTIFNNPGGPLIVEPFYTNDCFDVLPSILTPTMQFLNYMFTLYKFGKVLSVRFVLTFDNREDDPVDLYFFVSAQSLAASFATKASLDTQSATRKLLWSDTMTEKYGKKSQSLMSVNVKPSLTYGNKQEYMGENDWAFTQSSNPAKLTHGAWVARTPNSTFAGGLTVKTVLNFKVLFYDPIDLPAPVSPPPVPAEIAEDIITNHSKPMSLHPNKLEKEQLKNQLYKILSHNSQLNPTQVREMVENACG